MSSRGEENSHGNGSRFCEILAHAAASLLLEKGVTLAVAESCTGGLITHLLTEVPGISDSFLMGVVAYSNEAKINQLAVPEKTILAHGAVSEEVALAMASGVRKAAAADIGIAVTGIASPTGASPEKPIGLVYIAISGPDGENVRKFNFKGSRSGIKEKAAAAALEMIKGESSPPCGISRRQ